MTTHTLKCWPNYFDAIDERKKNFDVRRDDRGFQKGDIVKLQKWDPEKQRYERYVTDNRIHEVERKIKYVLTGGQFGIEPGFVVLGF